MDKKLFGTRINKARKDRGLTAEKLAEACNINSTYLRQIEGGKKLPSLPVFATLCRELRVSPNYILPDLVEGTEAEKIQKIFSESDPTPSQIEMLAEMAGVILKERYTDALKLGMLTFYFATSGVYAEPVIEDRLAKQICRIVRETHLTLHEREELFLDTIRDDTLPEHIMSAKDCAYIFDVCAAGRVEDAREMLGRFVTAHAAK